MRKIISLLAITPFLLSACQSGDGDAATEAAAQPAMPPAVVTVQQPETGQWQEDISIVGSLMANRSAQISAEIAGLLENMHVDDGQAVRAGQKLFTLDSATLDAEMKRAHALVQLRSEEIKRTQSLFERNVASQYDVDKAVAELATAEADEEYARAQLAKATITAPFEGNVGIRKVNPGNYVKEGEGLIELVQLDPVLLDFHLPETALSVVGVNQDINVEIPALNRQVTAKVMAIEPAVTAATRSLLVRARIDNQNSDLRPGLFARIHLPLAAPLPVLWVPESAVFYQGGKSWVMLNNEGTAQRIPVELAGFHGGKVAIQHGLEAGAPVVIAGHHKAPFDGMPLMVAPPPPVESGTPSTTAQPTAN
ncbi:Multidrug resistance protein MdtA [BD1-7 clade bacterium]|uniref:Multidrug resistance protein MdtA n=1 Tax=BD1-7 clade bacterium TaxID=2029982 RepID=A0A5S9R1F7_9GAMM|nr:Multidrug resistance protein MdtA [BD1-7 clade bacterium]